MVRVFVDDFIMIDEKLLVNLPSAQKILKITSELQSSFNSDLFKESVVHWSEKMYSHYLRKI